MAEAVILEAVRAPFGRRDGAYRETRPDSLLAAVLQGLMARAGMPLDVVEDVITGCVTQVNEQGANVGRLAALLAGFPARVPAVTLDRMCGSSQQAVHFASQAIVAGDMTVAIGAGHRNMTRVPMFSNIGGGFETLNPELLDAYELVHQGESAERIADRWGLARDEVDAFAAESHRRAHAAARAGCHSEILPQPGVDRDGQPMTLSRDEGIRPVVDREKMAALPTVFRPAGNGGRHRGQRQPDQRRRLGRARR
jgi:acetyl-CoA acyltransferase